MKFEQYERPELEEIELLLEGSFEDVPTQGTEDKDPDSSNPGVGTKPGEGDGDDWG